MKKTYRIIGVTHVLDNQRTSTLYESPIMPLLSDIKDAAETSLYEYYQVVYYEWLDDETIDVASTKELVLINRVYLQNF